MSSSSHNWVQAFGIELGAKISARHYGCGGKKWHVDTAYIKIEGRWRYLYRSIDKEVNLLDIYLIDTRDLLAAEKFFMQAQETTGIIPTQIRTDKEPVLYQAIENTFPKCVKIVIISI